MKINFTRLLILAMLLSFAPKALHATTNRFNLINDYPSVAPTSFFFVQTTDQAGRRSLNLGTMFTYGNQPLKVYRNGVHVRDGMEHLLVSHIYGAYGLSKRLQVGLDLPVALFYRYGDFETVISDINSYTSLGDMRISGQFQLLDKLEKMFGLALGSWLSLPTGRSAHFLGLSKPEGSVWLSAEKNISDRFSLVANVGGIFHEEVDANDIKFGQQLMLAGGISSKLSKQISLVLEGDVKTPFNNFFQSTKTTPAELRAGISWKFKNGRWNLKAGGGWGISNGSADPKWSGFAGISYLFASKKDEKKVSAAQENAIRQPVVIKPVHVVHYAFDRSNIVKQEADELKKMVNTINNAKKIVLEGHADLWGNPAYNMKLSEKRAMSVKKFLLKNGVSEMDIEVQPLGSTRPIGTEMSFEGQKNNRRVEIKIVDSNAQ